MALSKVVTYNPTEVHEFDWVIDNFLTIGNIIYSPVIHPIPNCSEKWRIMLKFSNEGRNKRYKINKLEVYLLKEQSSIDKCNVRLILKLGLLTFGDESDFPVSIGNEKSYLLLSWEEAEYGGGVIMSLYKDNNQLLAKTKLTVSGYGVTYSSSPSPAIALENNCQDLSRDLERLYEDKTSADITFKVGGQKLFAHSNIIRCRSVVLAKMLEQDMLERRTRCVNITDASFQVFDCFLRYLYTARVKNESWETMFRLFSLGDKYAVSGLKTICSHWLGTNLKVETVSKCLTLAYLHEDEDLKQMSNEFIRDHLNDVLKTPSWKYLVSNQPQLASETLSFAMSRVEIS